MTVTARTEKLFPTFAAVVVAMAVGLASCSGSSVEASAPPHIRLQEIELKLAEGAAKRPRTKLYRRLEPGERSEWEILSKAPYRFEPMTEDSEGPQTLVFRAVGDAEITIPGPFDPNQFDYMGLEVDAGPRRRFEVRFHGRKKKTRSYIATRGSDGPEVLEFTVPKEAKNWNRIHRISIRVTGERRPVNILGASLVSSPPTTRLPAPEDGPDHVFANGESRLGYGLLTDRELVAEFEPVAGSRLRFSYAVPNVVALGQQDTTLNLRLEGTNGALQEFTYEFEVHAPELEPRKPIEWRTPIIPLTEFEDSMVTARWEVSGDGIPACAIAEPGLLLEGGEPRRVLMITSDTHRYDHLGSSGQGIEILTPNLDALSARSLNFEDCFTSTNTTNPSHVALMTGTSPRDTGIRENNSVLSDVAPTLAEAFRDAGYATYSSVSIKHLSPGSSGLGQGFQRSASPNTRAGDAERSIRRVINWMDESQDVSVFVWLHLFDAHTPYETEEPFSQMYYPAEERAFDPEIEFAEEVPEPVREKLYPELQDLDYPRSQYKSEISYLDQELGKLLDHPELHNAIIGFTADHGESLGNHGIYFSHDGLYPDTIHVPMILSFPGGPLGRRTSAPVEQIDLGRTLLDLSGLAGTEFPGKNIVGLADVPIEDIEPRFAVAAHHRSASITKNGMHLLIWMTEKSGQTSTYDPVFHAVELYDLRVDRECQNDLLEEKFELAAELRQELIDWLLSARHLNWQGKTLTDAQTIKELEALGYTAGGAETPEEKQAPLFMKNCPCDWCARF